MTSASWIFVLAVASCWIADAAECQPLSGTWRMDPQKSFFASIKEPTEQAENSTLTITQSETSIREDWTFEGSIIKGRAGYVFTTDGSEQKIAQGEPSLRAPVSIRAEWQNCTLVVHRKVLLYGSLPLEFKSTYVLSDQGKVLTIFQEAHSVFLESERRLVFRRQ